MIKHGGFPTTWVVHMWKPLWLPDHLAVTKRGNPCFVLNFFFFFFFYNSVLCLATSSEPEVGHVDLV